MHESRLILLFAGLRHLILHDNQLIQVCCPSLKCMLFTVEMVGLKAEAGLLAATPRCRSLQLVNSWRSPTMGSEALRASKTCPTASLRQFYAACNKIQLIQVACDCARDGCDTFLLVSLNNAG